ncbi:MAG: MlaD family protein [Longimicrobiales bacterium]
MNRKTEVIVGAVILVGAAVVFFGTVWLRGARLGGQETTIQARFREVGQLAPGNVVKLRGVPIGRVDELELEPASGGVIVTATVASSVALPEDAVMLLAPESLFGDWQAELFPRSRFPGYDYAEPRQPGVLPGYSLPDISRLTAVADEIAENLAVLTGRVELAFTEESALRVRDAIENIQELSTQLASLVQRQERSFQALTDDFAETAENMGQAALSVRQVATQIEGAVAQGQVTQIVQNLQSASAKVDSLTAAWVVLSGNLSSAAMTVDTTFRSFAEVATLAARGEGTLGRLLSDTTLYAQLVESNVQLQALIADIQANPRRYIRLEIF